MSLFKPNSLKVKFLPPSAEAFKAPPSKPRNSFNSKKLPLRPGQSQRSVGPKEKVSSRRPRGRRRSRRRHRPSPPPIPAEVLQRRQKLLSFASKEMLSRLPFFFKKSSPLPASKVSKNLLPVSKDTFISRNSFFSHNAFESFFLSPSAMASLRLTGKRKLFRLRKPRRLLRAKPLLLRSLRRWLTLTLRKTLRRRFLHRRRHRKSYSLSKLKGKHRRRFFYRLISFLRTHPLSKTLRYRKFARSLAVFLRNRSSKRFSSTLLRLKLKSLFSSLNYPFSPNRLRFYCKLKQSPHFRKRLLNLSSSIRLFNNYLSKPKLLHTFGVSYGEVPKFIRRKLKSKRKRLHPRRRRFRTPKGQKSPAMKVPRPSNPLLLKRSYSYLFALPSLPLWLSHFFYFFFNQREHLFICLWLNLFTCASFQKQRSYLYNILSLGTFSFFQRHSSLNFTNSYLYFDHVYDSQRFFRNAQLSLLDFDRRRLPRRSLWIVRKRPWRRYPQKIFEGYRRLSANAFFRKHILLSFDYPQKILYFVSPLVLFSNLKSYRHRQKI